MEEARVDAWRTWTVSPGGAAIATVLCVDILYLHTHHLLFDLLGSLPRPPEVKMSLIDRRVRELLDHVRVRYTTGTHSDAKSRAARDLPVPRSNFRRAATIFRGAEKLSTFEPTRLRNRPKAFRTGVRPY